LTNNIANALENY